MRDLREWLAIVEGLGELRDVRGAHPDREIGILTGESSRRHGPALIFRDIPGSPAGFCLLTSTVQSRRRVTLTMHLPECQTDAELIAALEDKPARWEAEAPAFPPLPVPDGPVQEITLMESRLDLTTLPAPRWHPEDGGRYLGTGCVVIMRDPDTGRVNLGTYRIMLVDEKTATLYISPGKHGYLIMRKYHQRGEPCPVAVSLGHDPLFLIVSGLPIPAEVGEYNYIGAVAGERVPVIEGPRTGLPVPAQSELVLEGECLPGETAPEGPFGEWTGYYAGGRAPAPLLRVRSMIMRPDPVLVGCSPARRGDLYEIMYYRAFLRSAMIKKALQTAGIPGVQGVWTPEWSGVRLWVVVSIQQQYAGHARQAGLVAAQCRDGAYLGRYVIVVDDDIDPTDQNEVLWAICTRSDPANDIEFIRRAWSSRLDPIPSPESVPEENAFYNSRAIIDACIPFERRRHFPRRISHRREAEREVLARWQHLFN